MKKKKQHGKDDNTVRTMLRIPRYVHERVTELAQDVEQPVSECFRALVIKGLAEIELPTVAVARRQTQALAELIYIIRGWCSDEPELLEQAKQHGAVIVSQLFESLDKKQQGSQSIDR